MQLKKKSIPSYPPKKENSKLLWLENRPWERLFYTVPQVIVINLDNQSTGYKKTKTKC